MDFGESYFSRDFIEYLLSHSVMFGGTFYRTTFPSTAWCSPPPCWGRGARGPWWTGSCPPSISTTRRPSSPSHAALGSSAMMPRTPEFLRTSGGTSCEDKILPGIVQKVCGFEQHCSVHYDLHPQLFVMTKMLKRIVVTKVGWNDKEVMLQLIYSWFRRSVAKYRAA